MIKFKIRILKSVLFIFPIMIKLDNVSLSIPIYTNETRLLKKTLIRSVTGGIIKRNSSDISVIKALSNISCTINKKDRVGLLGHNGSGKTTFLKTISGIYQPTSGKIISSKIKVFPMIVKSFITSVELSGFVAAKSHYMMNHGNDKGFSEYLEKLIDFSGLGDYIYLPIKSYSQGMASRLLFTILTSFDYECLALDEGFGTGDSEFTDKAEKRLDEFIDQAGTLIFASHSVELLKRFCTRGLVFDKGTIIFDGTLNDALNYYNG